MRKPKNKKLIIICVAVVVAIIAVVMFAVFSDDIMENVYEDYKAPVPLFNSAQSEEEVAAMPEGDFYVSTNGDDSADGSKSAPFRTIERAVEAVRNVDKTVRSSITVCIEAGEYRISSLELTKEDSGTAQCPVKYCAYGGEVVFNGGVTLAPESFVPVGNYREIASRLSAEAQQNVVAVDLTKAPYSLTADDWGKIYAIGSYNTAASYDGDYTGPIYCELFVNDKRQTVARYPDSDYLYTTEVVSTGLGKESDGALTAVENWSEIRNPRSDVYRVDEALASRIAGWDNLDEVWMFGYWKYDWADASSPIGSFNKDTRELSPRFVSLYGTKTDAPYYFFNVLEELSAPGEWYLDRESGILCMWKSDGFENAQIDLSLSLEPIVSCEADYVTFESITFKGTRADAVIIQGDNNAVQKCLIKNVAGNALIMDGSNNLAYGNEITRTGKGGIIISGGDVQTLTAGNSKAENNYIHDWSEIYQTYQPAVTLNGVGNVCAHNEMVNSPHEAVTYTGNNHIIEYNLIHDVCLLSDDAGAIYAGRSWVWYGNVIRYNCIYNIGSQGHSPSGIYLDDALSGQQVYGNILVNIPRYAFLIGGGRDNMIKNNIVVNAGDCAFYFDDRARQGALADGWFTHSRLETGEMWADLFASPWQSEIWQSAYPQYKSFTADVSQAETSGFVANPASTVTSNLIFDKTCEFGYVDGSVNDFGNIYGNAVYYLSKADSVFVNLDGGDYNVADIEKLREHLPDFENLPLDKIGRLP